MHLDGDLYNSLKHPLNNLSEKIAINGIVVIDDFMLHEKHKKNEGFPGARKAVEEFLIENPNFKIKESIRGTPFLLRVE